MNNGSVYTLDEIRERIIPVAQKYNIPLVYIFGSYARKDATSESDIDLLIDADYITGFFAIGSVFTALEESLGKEIDLITLRAFEKSDDLLFVERVTKERVLIYDDRERLECYTAYKTAL